MEYANQNVVVQKPEIVQEEIQLLPLCEFQLALIGGGVGEVVFG